MFFAISDVCALFLPTSAICSDNGFLPIVASWYLSLQGDHEGKKGTSYTRMLRSYTPLSRLYLAAATAAGPPGPCGPIISWGPCPGIRTL